MMSRTATQTLNKSVYFLLSLTAALLIAFATSNWQIANAKATAPTEQLFEFSKADARITLDIIEQLQNQHYRRLELDDQFSINLMDSYIESLDPLRIYFTQADIKEFHKYRTELDDMIIDGDLSLIATIYNRYYASSTRLLRYSVDNLETMLEDFDFENTKDAISLDRESAEPPADENEVMALWYKRVQNDVLNLRLADETDEEILKTLGKRYQTRLERMEKRKVEDVYDIFINNLSRQYDPHTSWMSPRTMENFKINMSLSLEGIGAVLQKDGEHTKVVRLVTGGPAFKQGELKAGDKITGVAQGDEDIEDVVGWRLDEVVQLIRGPKDSTVRLLIEGSDQEAKVVSIVREKVKLEDQAAQKTIIEVKTDDGAKRIGVVDIPNFYMDFDAFRRGDRDYKSTTRDVIRLIGELEQEGIDGLVVDLRSNGGGSLREAATLTDLFIDRGPVVQIRNANDQISRRYRSQRPPLYTGPLLVLLNHLSASASEIFAGAIQDYQRGLVVGAQTYGKGTVQTLSELSSGQLKLTTAKFYRVSGDSTQHRGVVPDITYPSLYDFEKVGESALDYALPWDQIHSISHLKYNDIGPYLGKLTENHQSRMAESPDYNFLLQRIEIQNERSEIKTLSLNESVRREDTEQFNQTMLDLNNALREEKGLELFADFEALEQDLDDKAAKSSGVNLIDVENDFLLEESAYILSDFINLKSKDVEKIASEGHFSEL